MATTQSKLEQLEHNVNESIGARKQPSLRPKLSPVASAKDVGRRPSRNYGRIDLNQVIPDPSQPRTEFAQDAIEQLAQSFLDRGQLAPIRVRWSADHGKWIVIYGERRLRAAQAAKAKTIECYFDDRQISEAEILEQQMIENLLRRDLTPIEQARGFSALMDLHGWNGKQVAKSLSVPESTVSRALALLDLPQDVQQKVDSGEVAARSAYEISKLGEESQQRDFAEKAANGMTLKETQAAVLSTRKPKRRPAKKPKAKRLEFFAENGWHVVATPPKDGSCRTYDDLKQALDHIQEDVDVRIRGNIRID